MSIMFHPGPLNGLVIIEPKLLSDNRGYFYESYKKSDFKSSGIVEEFVQDNHSQSRKGVLRGLHYQRHPHAQGKLVRVVVGRVWDVAVDLRIDSPTYGKWFGLEISSDNKILLYIPPGFAHGFLTLSDTAELLYKCTSEYNKFYEEGILWNDTDIAINWPSVDVEIIVSEKDRKLPFFKSIR